MSLLIKTNKLAFYILFSLTLLLSVLCNFFLPEKYFNDANYIVQKKLHGIEEIGSYAFTIKFYEVTYLGKLDYSIVALIQFTILMYIIRKIGLPQNFDKINIRNIIIYLSIFMLAIFVSMPSKEFITFVFLSIIVFLFQSDYSIRKKIVFSFILFGIFGLVFRIYFVLIPIFSSIMYLVSKVKFQNKILSTLTVGIVVAIFISLTYGILKGEYMSEGSREFVNSIRMHSKEAESMIVSPVKTSTWYGESVGILYGFFSVNFPVYEGLRHINKPQVIAFVTWELLLLYILFVRYKRALTVRKHKIIEIWTILFLFSFFIIQGIFEPDLGTATRHKIGFLPLIYFVLYYDYIGKNKQVNP